ncbi:MAG: hypothetical protein FWD33_03685 [Alphaproteobacteria bacterium]|nr:hypothetical protein [Alphaproteobacteria bacterium]
MKKFIIIGLVFVGILGAGNVRAVEFLPNFEDVPMMSGLQAVDAGGFLFSVPEGKIVETIAVSDSVTRRQFQRFYRDALRGLGWVVVKEDSKVQEFSRSGDRLSVEVLSASPLEVRFSLIPVGEE